MSARQFTRYFIVLGALATAVLFWIAAVPVKCAGIDAAAPACVLLSIGLCAAYTPGSARMTVMVSCLEALSLLLAGTAIGGLATYPLAALSSGWTDASLLSWDRALGADWPLYWTFVQRNPWLYAAMGAAYYSIFVSPAALIVGLIVTGRADHAYRFIAAFLIAICITDTVFAFFPAKSAAEHFLAVSAPNAPGPGFLHIPIIERLRAGSPSGVEIGHLNGLITFPSFHAAASVLFAWAAWPMRRLGIPALGFYALMLAATPIYGGHYFVDCLGGVAVAGVAIIIARQLRLTMSAGGRHGVPHVDQGHGDAIWRPDARLVGA